MLQVRKKRYKLILLQAKGMGRKPAGEKLSNAEKLKRYRKKNKEILKEKDNLRKRKSREKFMKDFALLHKEKVKQEPKRRDKKMQQTTTLMRNHWSTL